MKNRRKERFVQTAVEEFEKSLVSYAAHIVGDHERARDVVQETFLRLCKEDTSSVEDHLAPWLFTVCRNLALDVARKEARMKPMTDTRAEMSTGDGSPPSAVLETKESINKVLEVVESLPVKQQEALRLKFQQGLRYRQIADVMETSVSNVGVLIHTGINTVRGKLAPLQPDFGKGGAA
ncbi:RNA polymerase sigma factor [Planctomycetota bacterium]